jgi:arylsulfatase A-like enzyme
LSGKKLIIIDIDGILPDVLHTVIDDPKSNMHRIAGKGMRAERALSIFPAVTLCCQASMFTGVWPGTHGILGNSWFDRYKSPPEFRYYTEAKTAVGIYGYGLFGWPTGILPKRPGMELANKDLNPNVKTIYQMAHDAGLSSWQLFNQFSRGVDKWIKPSRPAMLLFALCHEELVHNKYWDRSTFRHLYREMKKDTLPDLLVFYLSGLDNNGHENGAQDQLDYFREVLDPLFGRFISEFEKRTPLESLNFIITSDHGQASVIKEKEYIIENALLAEILSAAPGGGFHLAERKKVLPTDTAVCNMEAGATQFHLINRKSFDWAEPPRFEEDVLPAAGAFAPYKTGKPPFVDFILARRSVEEGYMAYEGGEMITLEKFFEGKDEQYPDAAARIRGLNCDRSGDLIVILDYTQGYYFGDKVKAGEHGNICAADALVPFVISGPGIKNKTIPSASILDIVPTAGAILGFDTTGAQGKSLI